MPINGLQNKFSLTDPAFAAIEIVTPMSEVSSVSSKAMYMEFRCFTASSGAQGTDGLGDGDGDGEGDGGDGEGDGEGDGGVGEGDGGVGEGLGDGLGVGAGPGAGAGLGLCVVVSPPQPCNTTPIGTINAEHASFANILVRSTK